MLQSGTEPIVMNRRSFAEIKFAAERKAARRPWLVAFMEWVVGRERPIEPLEPQCFPQSGKYRGRPSIGLAPLLRLYFVPQPNGPADKATDGALYDRQALSGCRGIDARADSVPTQWRKSYMEAARTTLMIPFVTELIGNQYRDQ